MEYYLAIDIGASSGRHIVGWRENNEIKRFFVSRTARKGRITVLCGILTVFSKTLKKALKPQ